MEHNHRAEQSPQESEVSLHNFHQLHEQLGFVETEELQITRLHSIEAFADKNDHNVKSFIGKYQLLGEKQIAALEGNDYSRGQIGLIVATATLHIDTGNYKSFICAITDALDYAYNMYEDDIVDVLDKVPSVAIAHILIQYGLSDHTLTEIADRPYHESLKMAYEYLTQAGLDADDILREFMDDSLE